jgi:hypothetical protein
MWSGARAKEELHNGVRESVYRAMKENAVAEVKALGYTVSDIGAGALIAWDRQWEESRTVKREYGGWDWRALRKHYNEPDRFDVALWCGELLCGLAIGQPSAKGRFLVMHYLERRYGDSNPLRRRVIRLVSAGVVDYAERLGCEAVRIWRPAQGLIVKYTAIDYHYHPPKGGLQAYCELVLGEEE